MGIITGKVSSEKSLEGQNRTYIEEDRKPSVSGLVLWTPLESFKGILKGMKDGVRV
jgi:hypothetical protein